MNSTNTWVRDSAGEKTAENSGPVSKTDENWEKLGLDSGLRLLSGLEFNVGDKVIGKK